MAKLLYVMNASLDGYVADQDGNLDWTAPDEEDRASSTPWSGRSAPTYTDAGCTS